ncbi:MAG TPA: efflux RND transporter periplasmic adaptor subunit [Mesorhizobium sp.]
MRGKAAAATADEKAGRRRSALMRAATALLLVPGMAALSGCEQRQAAPQKQPVRVRVAEAALEKYSPVYALTGIIAARTETNVSFRIGGRVAERLVDVGDHVDAGTVLARLDPQEQQSDVRSAQAAVDAATANLTQTTAAFQRQDALLKQGFTTRRDYDQAQQAMQVAQGSLGAAQSQLQNAKEGLGYTELSAARPGLITQRNIEAGQVVQAAQTIYTIAEDGDRDAVFYLNEAALVNMPVNPPVKITLISNPSITAPGIGRELSPVIDPASGTIRAKVSIPNTPAEMALGAAITGSVQVQPVESILLPWRALFSDAGLPAVWIVDRVTNAVSLSRVTVLSFTSGTVAISKGLSEGQQVVTAGVQLLRPGQVVEIAAEPAK